MNTVTVRLDLNKAPRRKQVVYLRRGDRNGTTIQAVITDNNVEFDLTGKTVYLVMRTPNDDAYYEVEGETEGNVATFLVDESYVAPSAGSSGTNYVRVEDGETTRASAGSFSTVVLEDGTEGVDPADYHGNGVAEFLKEAQEAFDSSLEEYEAAAASAIARANAAAQAAEDVVLGDIALMSEEVRGGAKLGWGLEVADGRLCVSDELRLPEYDPSTGRYDNASIKTWLDSGRDGLEYSVLIPKYGYSTATACVKADANAGLVCEPSTAAVAGRDDYAHKGPFETWEVNGGADDGGDPFVTAFKGADSAFSRLGARGDVWMMRRVLWYRYDPDYSDTHARLSVCDTERDGYEIQPGGLLPDGTVRPYMLYSKYSGGMHDGKYASVSGVKAQNRTVSHNSLITLAAAKGAGYSGKSIAHDFIDKVDFLLIYAEKSSQKVFTGCTGYTLQCQPTVAESGVKRVIVSNANAASIEVGSAMMLGNQATSTTDRNNVNCYNVFDGLVVASKAAYDSGNTAIYFDTDATFDVEVGYRLSTAPWPCGALDGVLGLDGTITSAGRTNSREPFLLRGRECMVGFYEILSGVILDAKEQNGELLVEVNLVHDTSKDATSITADFIDTGVSLPTSSAAGWLYTRDFTDAGGLLVAQGQGASTTTGMGDGCYQNVATSKGTREFLGLGNLVNWGHAGVFCGGSDTWLGGAWWHTGSRLSVTGRSGVN